jgi:alkaline phosphatase D
MTRVTRREFATAAAVFGASLACGRQRTHRSKIEWHERRDLYPEGVASGDPYPDSVLLWTRRPPVNGGEARRLNLEIGEDPNFIA